MRDAVDPRRSGGIGASPSVVREALRRPRVVLPLVLAMVVVGIALAAAGAGVRMFVVESPSMGRAAPIGTLAVELPVGGGPLRVGDVVTYRTPGGRGTTTHRVVRSNRDGVRTRGDLNGAVDPWPVTRGMVVGRAVLLVPGGGLLLRIAPVVLGGVAVVWAATSLVPSATWRAGARLLGSAAVVSGVTAVLKPLAGYQVLLTTTRQGAMETTVVSTGLLPIRLSAARGGVLDLAQGAVGRLVLPADGRGHVAMTSAVHLDLPGWCLLVSVCLLPMLAILVVGLPSDRRADA